MIEASCSYRGLKSKDDSHACPSFSSAGVEHDARAMIITVLTIW